MNPLRTVSLFVVFLQAAACTSVDVSRYRLPRQHSATMEPEFAAKEPGAEVPRLAAPTMSEHARTPLVVPRIATPSVPLPQTSPQPPAPVIACDPGGCWSAGERYHGGTGSTYLDKNGRLCQSSGAWMQCY